MLDTSGAVALTRAESLDLLRPATCGRVAVSIQAIATVVPVPIAVQADGIVFVTCRGSVLDRAVHDGPVSVQVDGLQQAADGSVALWSVVVSAMTDQDRPEAVEHLPVWEWARAGGLDAETARVNKVSFARVQGWRAPWPAAAAACDPGNLVGVGSQG